MLINKKLTFLITSSILLAACTKRTVAENDNTPPVIAIISPLNNQHFNAGEIIQITAEASDNNKVIELHIHVSNTATGILLRDIHSYPGKSNATAEDSFAAETGVNYTIKILAIDAAQNQSSAEVFVQ